MAPALPEGLSPIGATIDIKKKELLVCTTKDIRFIDLAKGKIKRILYCLCDDKVIVFKFSIFNNKLLIRIIKSLPFSQLISFKEC